jgi:hypothetical protein
MPLEKGAGKSKKAKKAIASKNISEFHTGETYERTKAKFGKAKADKQAVAAGLHAAGLGRKRSK